MGTFTKEGLRRTIERESSEHEAKRSTVMIVDDERGNLAVMSTILAPHFHLMQANDGLEAIQLVEAMSDADSLECIVSDQRMPRLTGVELFERLRNTIPRACRIIVTGYTDVNVIVDAINKAAIYKFIVKPFDADDFRLTVQRAVEAVLMQRELDSYHADLENKVRERTVELSDKNMALEREIAARTQAERLAADERAFTLSLVKLTSREIECITWCAQGKTAWETGAILHVSEWTVVYHLESAKRKFGLTSKQQLVARAMGLGLLPAADAGTRPSA